MANRLPGALAALAVLALAGCTSPGSDDAPASQPPAGAAFTPASYQFDGEFLLGGVDAPLAFPFEVPEGAGEVAALLTWSIPGAVLEFQLLDPSGAVAADGWAEGDTRRYVATPQLPAPGEWSAVVTAQQGADAHFSLNVTARAAQPYGPVAQTYAIAGGAFAEINLNLVPGEAFEYSWTAGGDVYFNVHYHANGTTSRPIEATGREASGDFTAPDRQVYSLLWRNEGALPVEVAAQVDGSYRLHSMTRDG